MWLGRLAGLALAVAHLGGSYLALDCLDGTRCPLLNAPSPFSQVFFTELFEQSLLVGAFLYALMIAFWSFGRTPASFLRPVAGTFALSSGISVLLAADATLHPVASEAPSNWSGLAYALVTQHQALLALSLMLIVGVAVVTYRLMRSVFSLEYTGSGVQIKLPGQTVYYLPVFPQVSWQDTGIQLQQGERVSIELSGQVSPGALHRRVLDAWTEHMDDFVDQQSRALQEGTPLEDMDLKTPATWPYTGPQGYPAEWYEGDTKKEILRKHRLYGKDGFYKEDALLTVKGLPHNTVIGIIQPFGEGEPRNTENKKPAYDWFQEDDRKKLLLLSASQYPLEQQEIPRSGRLWVVINDVDIARWDNAGMFFLKLTRRAWL